MNILIVGRGAREHAIVLMCVKSSLTDRVYCAPGNAGIAQIANCIDIDENDFDSLAEFARAKHVDLTIVGPESPLVGGIDDRFEQEGLKILGPSKKAALIEGSKLYAKGLMKKYGIPSADYAAFSDTDANAAAWMAKEYIKKRGKPCVIKADGLASGKGVIVAKTVGEALKGADRLAHTQAARTLIVEEMLSGYECSCIALADGKRFILFPYSRDYKRAGDGDTGPNTGGMGAYSPLPRLTPEIRELMESIADSAFSALRAEGSEYKGFLYIGFIITPEGPKVLEFNCRLGDPEAQVILPALESDFIELCLAAADGGLRKIKVCWSNDALVDVVLASPGYPDSPKGGYKIYGLGEAAKHGVFIFHAGTRLDNAGELVTDGGRVLSVVGRGKSHETARKAAYDAAGQISFGNKDPDKGKQWFRRDIASKL